MLLQVGASRSRRFRPGRIAKYRELCPDLMSEIDRIAGDLRGVRVCHLNATAHGGGVAELLSCEVPFLRAAGIHTDWLVLSAPLEFFRATKGMHNALQGGHFDWSEEDARRYLRVNRSAGSEKLGDRYDVIIVHDPQPAPVRWLSDSGVAKWVRRCHIDSSSPDARAAEHIRPFLTPYDVAVFTMPDFVLPEMGTGRTVFLTPAIDPLAEKNRALAPESG